MNISGCDGMNTGYIMVTRSMYWKEGRSRIKILMGDPVLNGMWRANTTVGYWGIFLKYEVLWASLGHRRCPLSHDAERRYWQPCPSMVTYSMTAIGIPLVIGGGVRVIGRDICEHMNYRVFFNSTFSSTETFGFSTMPAVYTSFKKESCMSS